MTVGSQLGSNECLNDKNNMFAACMTPTGNLIIGLVQDIYLNEFKELYSSNTSCDDIGACSLKIESNRLIIWDSVN